MTDFDLNAEPAAPHADVKRAAAAAILAARDEILELSHRIHANPEPAYEEELAATWVADAIAARGFAVERPAGRLATGI
ncbi:MAG: amidohydrolase, partial [Chloroflexi bacterium]|nr:amidohydrolase [Chloroflexota bacterium]